MPLLRMRITIRTLMVMVAVAGWFVFNGRLIGEMLGGEFAPIAAGEGARVVAFTALAWLVAPPLGVGVAYAACWARIREGRHPAWTGLVAGAAAGFVAWNVVTILVCIGHGADGQTPMAALLMGCVGALINALPGVLVGAAWGWWHRQ